MDHLDSQDRLVLVALQVIRVLLAHKEAQDPEDLLEPQVLQDLKVQRVT